jgi:hypothetical protein
VVAALTVFAVFIYPDVLARFPSLRGLTR